MRQHQKSPKRPAAVTPTSAAALSIVGAGPGDPELLTVKALNRLRAAEVVIYDNLVGPEILELARPTARRIHVGKAKGRHSYSQDAINALMLAQAASGRRVVRLKGGDPFVFGRGGEELAYLRAQGVEVEIVPGITAATACAAAADIPLTQRGIAQAVTFVTGHGEHGEPELDWPALARGGQTLAFYMAVTTAGPITRRLLQHGLSASTPAAIIEKGSLPEQRVFVTDVARLQDVITRESVSGPALLLIGEVVRGASSGALTPFAEAV